MAEMDESQRQSQAWVGDGVLGLYARMRILRQTGKVDGAAFARMTSNQFLSAFGDPTSVEAEIGRVFEQGGLEEAFRWIEHKLTPVFERQERNRARR